MATWFAHPASNIDAEEEWKASKRRDPGAWARLAVRLTSATIDPASTRDDEIVGQTGLRFFRCGDEAMVYETDHSGLPRVFIVGATAGREDEGRLILEAARRSKLR
jgi:hypothetical protein